MCFAGIKKKKIIRNYQNYVYYLEQIRLCKQKFSEVLFPRPVLFLDNSLMNGLQAVMTAQATTVSELIKRLGGEGV